MSSSKKTSDDGSTKQFVHFHKSLTDAQPNLTALAAFEIVSRQDLRLLDTDDFSAIEKKFIDFAVHSGFPSHHVESILNLGTPQFLYHSLLGKMEEAAYRVGRAFIIPMAEGLKGIDPKLLAEVQKWSVLRPPWENPNAVPETSRFVSREAVDAT